VGAAHFFLAWREQVAKRAPEDLLQAIESVAAPILEAQGLTLVDLEFRWHGRRGLLRLFIDKPGGVGIVDCQRFSEEVGDHLDVADLIPDGYDLEVSSPGLDRELKTDRELQWATGKLVRCWTLAPVEGKSEVLGRLLEFGADNLVLEAAGTRWTIPRFLATKVRLQLERPG